MLMRLKPGLIIKTLKKYNSVSKSAKALRLARSTFGDGKKDRF